MHNASRLLSSPALSEVAEKLEEGARYQRAEHSDGLLVDAWLDGHVYAPVSLDTVLSVSVLGSAVYHDLGPSKWSHGPVGHLERQIPYDFLQLTALTFKGILSHPCSLASLHQTPVLSGHEVIVRLQAV